MEDDIQRVIAYIDGFNLYFGLKSKGWKRYYWLNIQAMAQKLLRKDQRLETTKYFTSRVSNDQQKQKRQNDFIEAISTLHDVQLFYGKFQLNPRQCRYCGKSEQVPNEKMTDVNIAVEMLADAFSDAFDVALLVSADSDLVAPVRKIRQLFPEKRIVPCFPPERYSSDLKAAAGVSIPIGRGIFADSQFPDEIVKPGGFILKRPDRWR
jgi:uncharacterized LabA/DUF88 family protein